MRVFNAVNELLRNRQTQVGDNSWRSSAPPHEELLQESMPDLEEEELIDEGEF